MFRGKNSRWTGRVTALLCLLFVFTALPTATVAEDSAAQDLSWLGAEAPQFPPLGQIPPSSTEPLGVRHSFDLSDKTLPKMVDDRAEYQTIFPPDDRQRVTPTTSFPWSAISLVLAEDRYGRVSACSGAFIGPQVVLTAAHCIYGSDKGGWADTIGVFPGNDGDHHPFGADLAVDAWVPSGWYYGEDFSWDWAVIKVPTPMGNTVGWFQIGVLSDQSLMDPHFQPVLAGYPGDKPLGTQWAAMEEAFHQVSPTTLYTKLDAYPGQSGSAIWRARDGVIVGVLNHQYPQWNEAARIDKGFLDHLLNACNEMRCWFSYAVEQPSNPSGVKPTLTGLTPAPFTTVGPGGIRVSATAQSDSPIVEMQLELFNTGQTFMSNTGSVAGDINLPPGVYTLGAFALDAEGDGFSAVWDFIVSSNPADGEWFWANGQPNPDQINATMRSLVEAFRWHLFGQSWDGGIHSDLPTHAQSVSQAPPVETWVHGSSFDRAATEATLRSLVEAFRWHFWGISWDGQPHWDIPTHAGTVQGPQSIDPWFTADGQPIPQNITATLRSLVEAFRWHFWQYSWDGGHHPDIPAHS